MKKRKKTVLPSGPVDPEYFLRQKEELLRSHRQVIYLNSRELAAIKTYCERFHIQGRSRLLREAVMERVLKQLEESHPTLF